MLPTLSDNPITRIDNDAYGFRPYIEELHTLVSAAPSLPLTVGVFGSWGSGKSSFLKMWENLLAFAPSTRTVWFNPWKYDQKIEVWAAFIQSLLAEMQMEEGPLQSQAAKLARTAAWLLLRGGLNVVGSVATGVPTDGKIVDDLFDNVAKKDADFYRDMNRFELDFAEAVRSFVGETGRLVVFVDDLDRCVPSAALNILEALKLFVGDARCVFVLSMDFDLVTSVAGSKFGVEAPVTGSAYLEKIIQLPFFLPDIGFDALRASLVDFTGGLADSEAFWELVEIGLGANPRRLKRYINVLNLAVAIARRETGDATVDLTRQLQLAKLLILRSEHRLFFNHLLADAGAWSRLESSPALPEDRSGTVELERERDPIFVNFLKNEYLCRLIMIRRGSPHGHPPAPNAVELSRMLRTVRLTSGTEPDVLPSSGPVRN
jgi:hypothetical protein